MSTRGDLRDGVVAGVVGAVVGGIPSTVHAMATGRDPLEATRAAGALVVPHEQRLSRLVPAAAVVHLTLSVGWGVAMALALPRRGALPGAGAGLAIAALDLGLVGRRVPAVKALALGPQVLDHLVFGAAVGAVLRRSSSS